MTTFETHSALKFLSLSEDGGENYVAKPWYDNEGDCHGGPPVVTIHQIAMSQVDVRTDVDAVNNEQQKEGKHKPNLF